MHGGRPGRRRRGDQRGHPARRVQRRALGRGGRAEPERGRRAGGGRARAERRGRRRARAGAPPEPARCSLCERAGASAAQGLPVAAADSEVRGLAARTTSPGRLAASMAPHAAEAHHAASCASCACGGVHAQSCSIRVGVASLSEAPGRCAGGAARRARRRRAAAVDRGEPAVQGGGGLSLRGAAGALGSGTVADVRGRHATVLRMRSETFHKQKLLLI